MINRNQERETKPSFLPKFSDPDIIKGILYPDFWKLVFLRDKKAIWLFFKALVNLKTEMFVSPLRMYLRFNHGRRTIGIMITLMSTFMMIAFNTEWVVGALTTFFPLVAPIVPIFMKVEQLKLALFVDIRSEALIIFWMGYVLISLIHLVRMYKGYGQSASPTSRGGSILYLLIFKHLKMPEYIVQRFAEPLLTGGTGFFLISMGTDFTLGLFLLIAAGCLFFQECFDAVMKFSLPS